MEIIFSKVHLAVDIHITWKKPERSVTINSNLRHLKLKTIYFEMR